MPCRCPYNIPCPWSVRYYVYALVICLALMRPLWYFNAIITYICRNSTTKIVESNCLEVTPCQWSILSIWSRNVIIINLCRLWWCLLHHLWLYERKTFLLIGQSCYIIYYRTHQFICNICLKTIQARVPVKLQSGEYANLDYSDYQ